MLTIFRGWKLFALNVVLIALCLLWYTGYLRYVGELISLHIFPIEIPEKPPNVPSSAFWIGNRDFGQWMYFEAIPGSDKCLKCRRYRSPSGEIYPQEWWETGVFCLEGGSIGIDTLEFLRGGSDGTVIKLVDGRFLYPELNAVRDSLSRILPGMTQEEVSSIVVFLTDWYDSDSVFHVYEIDVPYIVKQSPFCYFDAKTNRLVTLEWGDIGYGTMNEDAHLPDSNFSVLERAVLEWTKNHYNNEALSAQVDAAKFRNREYTVVGFYVYFDVPREIPKVDPKAIYGESPVPGPLIYSKDIEFGAHSLIWDSSGYINCLEMVAFGSHFSENVTDFRFKAWEDQVARTPDFWERLKEIGRAVTGE